LDFWKTVIFNFYFIFTNVHETYLNLIIFNMYNTYHILYFSRIYILVYWMSHIWYCCISHDQRLVIAKVFTSISNRHKCRDRLCYLQVLWYNVLLRLATSLMPLQPATTSRICLEIAIMIIWRGIIICIKLNSFSHKYRKVL